MAGHPTTERERKSERDRDIDRLSVKREHFAVAPRASGPVAGPAAPTRWTDVRRFPEGLVFEAHRPVYHSTLGSRTVEKKKKKQKTRWTTRVLFPSILRSYVTKLFILQNWFRMDGLGSIYSATLV